MENESTSRGKLTLVVCLGESSRLIGENEDVSAYCREILGIAEEPAFADVLAMPVFACLPRDTPGYWGRRADTLDYWERRAAERDAAYAPEGRTPCLKNYFALSCTDAEVVLKLYKHLEGAVPSLYLEPIFSLPEAQDEPDVARICNEGHLSLAPEGVSAAYAWQFLGGDGASLRFVDVEASWLLQHPELSDASITLISGINDEDKGGHGTAVLSIIAARDDRNSVTGIVPNLASGRVISIRRNPSVNRMADAIFAAIPELRFGDVLLLELQVANPHAKRQILPAESEPAVFEAVRIAIAKGIVVVGAAGNGGSRLPEMSDSGAILVGASSRFRPYRRWRGSNFGSRVCCFAWGEGIPAADMPIYLRYLSKSTVRAWLQAVHTSSGVHFESYQDIGSLLLQANALRDSFDVFSGTSAASAIIAGVALSTQGLAQANLGFRFSPWQLRLILSDPANGTSSANPARDRIGVMPDLKKIIDHALCLPRDIYLRDSLCDAGDLPREGRWESPDILVSAAPLDVEEFKEGSSRENDDFTREPVLLDAGTQIYVRLRNRGREDAERIDVRLFCSPITTLPVPELWEEIGVTTVTVDQADVLTVSPAVPWPSGKAAPAEGLLWIALAQSPRDRVELPGGLGGLSEGDQAELRDALCRAPSLEGLKFLAKEDWLELLKLLAQCKQIAFRSLHVEHHPPGDRAHGTQEKVEAWLRLPFYAPGAPKEELPMRLEVVSRLPRQAKVWIEMPPRLADLRGIWGEPPLPDDEAAARKAQKERERSVFVPLNPNGRNYLRERKFPAGMNDEDHRLRLHVWVPPDFRHAPYRISVRQLFKDEGRQTAWRQVGRVTWRLVPRT